MGLPSDSHHWIADPVEMPWHDTGMGFVRRQTDTLWHPLIGSGFHSSLPFNSVATEWLSVQFCSFDRSPSAYSLGSVKYPPQNGDNGRPGGGVANKRTSGKHQANQPSRKEMKGEARLSGPVPRCSCFPFLLPISIFYWSNREASEAKFNLKMYSHSPPPRSFCLFVYIAEGASMWIYLYKYSSTQWKDDEWKIERPPSEWVTPLDVRSISQWVGGINGCRIKESLTGWRIRLIILL